MLICYVQESYVRSDEFGRDLSSVQTLLTKQETFDIGLDAFENEGKFILCQWDINYILKLYLSITLKCFNLTRYSKYNCLEGSTGYGWT